MGPGHDSWHDGIWHGAYAIQGGMGRSSTYLQECGLLKEWVESAFAAPLRNECKAVASGQIGKRNPKKFVFVPAGDTHDTGEDPPPTTEVLTHTSVNYLQGEQDTCLRDSLASALAAMGFVVEAQMVADDAGLVGCTLELVQRAQSVIQRTFAQSNLVFKKLQNHASAVKDIADLESDWPIVLILQTSDGCHGSHAVTTWNGMIFDSNWPHPLRWSQSSLDWCSGQHTQCVGFSRAYRICPGNIGDTLPLSNLSVGSQLRPSATEPNALAWIC